MSAHIAPTEIPEVLVITPTEWRDDRGYFIELHHESVYQQAGIGPIFRQDNHSRSRQGVVRGLHYQLRPPQGKLITVLRGEIFDVAVDLRRQSPTFGKWVGVTLSEENHQQLWVPPGFAHGFCVMSDEADVIYKCTEVWDASSDRCLRWNDPAIGIEWPLPRDIVPVLSVKDQHAPALIDAEVFT